MNTSESGYIIVNREDSLQQVAKDILLLEDPEGYNKEEPIVYKSLELAEKDRDLFNKKMPQYSPWSICKVTVSLEKI